MSDTPSGFADLGLPPFLLNTIRELGYEQPSPIQQAAIPPMMEGKDILGQAQTGTGKTAAFALPVLATIQAKSSKTQCLILAPTRELAIQVAEACQTYAHGIPNFHVLPIYGGQGYSHQLRNLKRGAQVVVGTPGRIMDHMRRGTLKLDQLSTIVLDEADEMLRMGFIDDVDWILAETPDNCRIALFSATMPKAVKQVSNKYLKNPEIIRIESKTSTAQTIDQHYWQVSGTHKLEALTRILEFETFDAIIIFVRTKVSTEDLAEKLNARGYASAPLNGDIQQSTREKTVDRLKKGKIDILVATDVAARGLDVERISHVINFDIPYDTEAYVHRIGRTGRAGRTGKAILFVSPRERRMLQAIEKTTRQSIKRMDLPSAHDINSMRIQQFKQQICDTLANQDISFFQDILEELKQERDLDPLQMAAALAQINQGERSFLVENIPERKTESQPRKAQGKPKPVRPLKAHPDLPLIRYRVDIGYQDSVKPGDLVGAIANEAGLESEYIGQIEIFKTYSTVDLPEGMPKEIFKLLQKTRVRQKPMSLAIETGRNPDENEESPRKQSKNPKNKRKRRDNTRSRMNDAGQQPRQMPKKRRAKPRKQENK